ncbi:metalloregulator ArsR/SmtB family transcription factor [Ornithinibacillus gellani]|uniref:DUF2087 domain-containing protein n=1 Tax=Ornithinibacillus gellani TaxID=2293253 RepID=UPI000F46DC12|nr:metalloregulator ArsR/SmtB family transcription factor [Ornithinibacillus gellani]TQS71028.1 metalloregulator ArsR/SmtB family transcription factor [Ornithinibacillus gellani]
MQIDRLVAFHKTLGDQNRIQIISMLRHGPLHGQAIAGKLGLTPATVSYHVTRLREIDVIYQRRDKNTIYFHLNEKKLAYMAEAILRIGGDDAMNKQQVDWTEKQKVIRNFFSKDGRLQTIPAQRKKKLIILEHMVDRLEFGKKYPEKDINAFIKQFHDDYATIRREWIMCHFMQRNDGIYELNPKEMWLI